MRINLKSKRTNVLYLSMSMTHLLPYATSQLVSCCMIYYLTTFPSIVGLWFQGKVLCSVKIDTTFGGLVRSLNKYL